MSRGSARALLGAFVVACLCSPAILAAAPSGAGVKGLQPATAKGSRATIAHYKAALSRPAGQVADREIAFCGRYLPIAVERVHADSEAAGGDTPALCRARLDGLQALAMCRWLNGDVAGARAGLSDLSVQRCGGKGKGGDGLERALTLAERWWDPEVLAATVAALSPERRKVGSKRLSEIARRRGFAQKSLGGKPRPSRGALVVLELVGTSPLARAGVRVGDVVELVDAAPMRTPADLRTRMSRDAKHSVIYWRNGKRLETVARGKGGVPEVVALPEQL